MKFPTAQNTLIGTGKADYAGILISSKRFGHVDTHLNLSYTLVGQPEGTHLSNIVGGALAAMLPIGRRFRVCSEVLATTSTGGGEGDVTGGPIVAEAADRKSVV